MGGASPAYTDLGYSPEKNRNHAPIKKMKYEEWVLKLEKDFRENTNPDRIYTPEERYKEISAFMRRHVQYELPKYKRGRDYSSLWRMIEDRLKKIFMQMGRQSEKEIAKNNALINQILVEEHVENNTHVYSADGIK